MSLKGCVNKWAERENVDDRVLLEWYNKVIADVSNTVEKKRKQTKKMTLKSPVISKHLEEFKRNLCMYQRIKPVIILLLSVRNFMLNSP